jgi:hypothetical protein
MIAYFVTFISNALNDFGMLLDILSNTEESSGRTILSQNVQHL